MENPIFMNGVEKWNMDGKKNLYPKRALDGATFMENPQSLIAGCISWGNFSMETPQP